MNLTRANLRLNPIIVKELRSRMRDWRAFATLTAMLVLLGGSSYLLYRLIMVASGYSSSPLSPQIGQALFMALAVLELFVIAAVAPAVTAGAISNEQEKLTYEMLLATPLRPGTILWGKMVSALSYVFLLIFAAIPMASLIFIFGGVTLREMLKGLVILVAVAVMLGMVGLFMSAWLGRTSRATVLSYLVVIGLLVGPMVVYIAVGILQQAEPPRWILVPNPLSALLSAISPSFRMDSGFGSIFWSLGMGLSGDLGMITGSRISQTSIPRPLYHYSLPLFGLITLGLYLLSTRLVRPTRRWAISRKELLLGGGAVLLFLLLTAGVFLATTGRYENFNLLSWRWPTGKEASGLNSYPDPEMAFTPTPLPPGADAAAVAYPLPAPYPGPLQAQPLSSADTAGLYTAVIRQLYLVDHTFDEAPNFPVLYIVMNTDDSIGDPDAPQSESHPIDKKAIEMIAEQLSPGSEAGLPAELRFIQSFDEAPLDPDRGTLVDGGAIITLGNPHPIQNDSAVLVSASLYFAMLGATGKTYILNQVDGAWQITGRTGVEWIR